MTGSSWPACKARPIHRTWWPLKIRPALREIDERDPIGVDTVFCAMCSFELSSQPHFRQRFMAAREANISLLASPTSLCSSMQVSA